MTFKEELIDTLSEIIEDVEAGRTVTASEKIKRLAVKLDKLGMGEPLHTK